jgi:hypothetical protein
MNRSEETKRVISRRSIGLAVATACLAAAMATVTLDAANGKHCRVCRVGGSLTLVAHAKPQDPEYPTLVYVAASGSVASKQRLCRNAGPVQL